MDALQKYAPLIFVVVATCIQYNLFVTPEKLEIKHREILQDVSQTYVTKSQYDDLKDQLKDVQRKVDEMYRVIVGGVK